MPCTPHWTACWILIHVPSVSQKCHTTHQTSLCFTQTCCYHDFNYSNLLISKPLNCQGNLNFLYISCLTFSSFVSFFILPVLKWKISLVFHLFFALGKRIGTLIRKIPQSYPTFNSNFPPLAISQGCSEKNVQLWMQLSAVMTHER